MRFIFYIMAFFITACGGGGVMTSEETIDTTNNFIKIANIVEQQEAKTSILVSDGTEFLTMKIKGKITSPGILRHAYLKIYEVDLIGQRIAFIGNSTTNALGEFEILVPNKNYIAIEVEALDGTYVDKYNQVIIEERINHMIINNQFQNVDQ